MSATAAQIAAVRRMVAEPLTTTYSDVQVQTFVEAHPLMDELGTDPYWWDTTTDPPVKVVTNGWIETYDLNAAAADIWEEKMAAVSNLISFSADGGNYQQSNQYEQYKKMAGYYRSRSSARNIPVFPSI